MKQSHGNWSVQRHVLIERCATSAAHDSERKNSSRTEFGAHCIIFSRPVFIAIHLLENDCKKKKRNETNMYKRLETTLRKRHPLPKIETEPRQRCGPTRREQFILTNNWQRPPNKRQVLREATTSHTNTKKNL